jgi:hypothetical protein
MGEVDLPRVTFGIIVLNGEPFTRYNLRSLYPLAHEIIVVEGAVEAAAGIATPDGHSTDGTLETLYDFKDKEDPENKVEIVAREGFWSEKDEQSQAYAQRATGDYLWQVDIDEFYHPDDMRLVLDMLSRDPEIAGMSFKQLAFWGGFEYVTDGWYLRNDGNIFHRLFRWEAGSRYATHRPPTVYDPQGRDVRELRYVSGHQMAKRGVLLYHYGLVFPKQVLDKCDYYDRASWVNRNQYRAWAEGSFLKLEHPFRVHNVYDRPSWLEKFSGSHPPQVEALRRDVLEGRLHVEMRSTDEIERLLVSRKYVVARLGLKALGHMDRQVARLRSIVRSLAGKQQRGNQEAAAPTGPH